MCTATAWRSQGGFPSAKHTTAALSYAADLPCVCAQGDNCEKGQMHIQIIFHRPPTPKYGCYAAGVGVP